VAADRQNPTPRRPKRRAFFAAAKGRFCGSEVIWLTADQEKTIRAAWLAGATQGEISMLADVSIDRLRARLRDQLADLPPRDRRFGSDRRAAPPTPHEIAARAAMLRRDWPEARWLGREPDEIDQDPHALEEAAP
jgi:hypothetical protein